MGKTAAGAVWLNADLVSPYDYWQYWRNTEDGDVGRFLKLFTVLPLDEIARLAALKGAGDQRGQEGARDRGDRAGARPRRGRRGRRDRAPTFEEGALAETLADASRSPRAEIDAGLGVLAAFVKAGLVTSNGEARRQIKGGGLQVNDASGHRREDALTPRDLTPEGVIKLSLGKKRHVLIKPV